MAVLNLGIPATSYPDKIDTESGPCLVVGGAPCVWGDIAPFYSDCGGKFGGRFDVICVNDIGMHFPGPVKHLYSNNNAYLDKWQKARRDSFVKTYGPIQFTHSNHVGGNVTWPWPGSGTSSLGAVYTALALGYDKVVLAGIPLDNSGHYFEPPWRKSNFINEVPNKGDTRIKYWDDAAKNVFGGCVTAQSGRLKDVLDAYANPR